MRQLVQENEPDWAKKSKIRIIFWKKLNNFQIFHFLIEKKKEKRRKNSGKIEKDD